MPFKILCSCGVALLAEDDLESLKVACPECGNYTLLPAVPNTARLPGNAVKIFIEAVKEKPLGRVEKAGTLRKRGGASRTNMSGSGDMSTANMVLIVVLVIVVLLILIFVGLNAT